MQELGFSVAFYCGCNNAVLLIWTKVHLNSFCSHIFSRDISYLLAYLYIMLHTILH